MAQDLVTTDTGEVESVQGKDVEDFVTFTVDGQLFGIPILKVQDILNLEEIASIPLAPPKVKGAINLRGRIVTVVSVRVCLGIGERDEGADGDDVTDMGVTIEQDGDLYALLVDSIGDIISVSSECYEGTPGTLDPLWREFTLGVYLLDERLMVVLDVERLLDIESQ